jgi:hypothetical protein
MNQELRDLKNICSVLHNIRRQPGGLPGMDIDSMIATAEKIYHERKDRFE